MYRLILHEYAYMENSADRLIGAKDSRIAIPETDMSETEGSMTTKASISITSKTERSTKDISEV